MLRFRTMNPSTILLIAIITSEIRYCQMQSHYGKEFYFGIPHNAQSACKEISLDIASKKRGKYSLTVPFLQRNDNGTIRANLTHIEIPCNITKSGKFKDARGIYLKANIEVAVYVTNYDKDTAETFLVLPKEQLGKNYCAAGYVPYASSAENYVLITALENGTNVSIYKNIVKATLQKITINQLEVSQYVTSDDLQDIKVTSDRPVSVITGTSCTNIPVGSSYCDTIFEQMIPTDSLGTTYIAPPTPPKKAYELRVTSLNTSKNKTICFYNQSRIYCGNDSTISLRMGDTPTVIVSSEPVAVYQYGYGNDYSLENVGDPFMTVIPALRQFLNQYYFVIPNVYKDTQNHISIIIQTHSIHGLTLDGSSINNANIFNVSKPLQNHTVLILNVTSGYHILQHDNRNIKFGLLVYGYGAKTDKFVGYGYPGGMELSTFDTSDTVTSSVSYNSNTTTPSVSSNSSTTSSNVSYSSSTTTPSVSSNSSTTTSNVSYSSSTTTPSVSSNSSTTTSNVTYSSSMTTLSVSSNSSTTTSNVSYSSSTTTPSVSSNSSISNNNSGVATPNMTASSFSKSNKSEQDSLGIVLGTVLGTTAALSLLLCLLFLIWRKKRKTEVEPERTDNREELTEEENNDTNVEGNGTN